MVHATYTVQTGQGGYYNVGFFHNLELGVGLHKFHNNSK